MILLSLTYAKHCSSAEVSKLQPSGQIWPTACFFANKTFIGTQPHPFVYILSMPASSFEELKERLFSKRLKYGLSGTSQKKYAKICSALLHVIKALGDILCPL